MSVAFLKRSLFSVLAVVFLLAIQLLTVLDGDAASGSRKFAVVEARASFRVRRVHRVLRARRFTEAVGRRVDSPGLT